MICFNDVGFQPFANKNRRIRLNINNNWPSGKPEPFRVLLKMPVKKGKISQKELDFCTLAVYDNYKSGQLNIACHFRVKSAIVASVYDQ